MLPKIAYRLICKWDNKGNKALFAQQTELTIVPQIKY